jgi:hypothetical protein
MRTAIVGVVVIAGMVIGVATAAPERRDGPSQRGGPFQLQSTLANADMLVVSANVGDKYQQLTVIDPKLHVMSVYHIEFATGRIALRSVRAFNFDLQMKQFNGKDPLPEEIESLLAPR